MFNECGLSALPAPRIGRESAAWIAAPPWAPAPCHVLLESCLGGGFLGPFLECLCPPRLMLIIEYILSISHNFISPVAGSCIDSSVSPISSVPTISHVLSCEMSNLSWIVEMRVKNPFLEFLQHELLDFLLDGEKRLPSPGSPERPSFGHALSRSLWYFS